MASGAGLEQSKYRPRIEPVEPATTRPVWSVMIPNYNCDAYLRETLASVLAQDPGPDVMQIQVVDDHSTDNPESLVHEMGEGRVEFFRQSRNVGYLANFETCLQRSRGTLVHLLHGDDCVRSGFYEHLQTAFEHNPGIGAAFCRHIYVDEQGNWGTISPLERGEPGVLDGWLSKIASGQRVATPSSRCPPGNVRSAWGL